MRRPASPDSSDRTPITPEEQARLGALLARVSTHTLLHSLAGLERDSQDARLLIAALLDRLPSHGDE